jgi:hypothetical protein
MRHREDCQQEMWRYGLEATVAVFVLEAEDFVQMICPDMMYLGVEC